MDKINEPDQQVAHLNEQQNDAENQEFSIKLPEDMMSVCLSLLDVQTLIRFKTLSLDIKDLIQSSHFIGMHLSKSTSNMNLVGYPSKDTWKFIPCEWTAEPFNLAEKRSMGFSVTFNACERADPITSCNGIMCFARSFLLPPKKIKYKGKVLPIKAPKYQWELSFLNPSTRQFGAKSPILELPGNITYLGFGYANNLHKVAVLNEYNGWKCNVYCMELREWRSIGDFPGIPTGMRDEPYGKFLKKNVHVTGTLNWLATTEERNKLWVVSLDLSEETFTDIQLPQELKDPYVEGARIGSLGEKLTFSCYNNRNLVIWRLDEEEKLNGETQTWTKFLTLNLDSLPSSPDMHPNAFFSFNLFEKLGILVLQNHGSLFKRRRHMIYYHYPSNSVVRMHRITFEGNEDVPTLWIDEANYVCSLYKPN